jgi:hypothetical protein
MFLNMSSLAALYIITTYDQQKNKIDQPVVEPHISAASANGIRMCGIDRPKRSGRLFIGLGRKCGIFAGLVTVKHVTV